MREGKNGRFKINKSRIGIGAVLVFLLVIISLWVYRTVFYYPDKASQYTEEIPTEEISYLNISCVHNKESKEYFISKDNRAFGEIQKILNDASIRDAEIKKKNKFSGEDNSSDKEFWDVSFKADENEDANYSLQKEREERKKLYLSIGKDVKCYNYKENLDKMLWECISSYEREFTIQDLKDLCRKKEKILCKEFDLCSNMEYLTSGRKITLENGWYLNVIMENGYSPDAEPEKLLLFKTGQEYLDIRDEGIMEFIDSEE